MKYFTVCHNGYKYDRRIFWGAMGIILLGMVYLFYAMDFDFSYRFYVKCDHDYCMNPYMNPDLWAYNEFTKVNYVEVCQSRHDWCSQLYLSRGEYGEPEPWLLRHFDSLAYSLLFLTLILNHFIHNRGKVPAITLNVPERWKKKAFDLYNNMEDDLNDKD